MRHALCALVVVTLISAASQAIAQNWKEHRPEGAGYVVEMPGESLRRSDRGSVCDSAAAFLSRR